MCIQRYLFWWFYPDPQVGEEYAHHSNINDPWNEAFIRITKHEGNWFRYRNRNGYEGSIKKQDLVAFYRLTLPVATKPIITGEEDEVPF